MPPRRIRCLSCGRLTASRFVLLLLLGGCAQLPAGEVAFGVLGDTPYSASEIERLDKLIDDINAEELAFVVHVGDIGSSAQACDDRWLEARKRQFARIRHAFVLVPGDNEWTDCRDPLERLRTWRSLFCNTSLQVEVQNSEYCEHLRWEAAGHVFVTLNVPGSNNNVGHAEHAPRMAAAFAWLEEAAVLAEKRDGLVILMQADPFVTLPRDGYGELRTRLRALGERLPRRVLLVHGDTHLYREDQPFPGLRRIEVWGSPFVSWIGVGILPGAIRISGPHHR